MERPIEDVIADVASFQFQAEWQPRLDELALELFSHPDAAGGVASVFRLLERAPDHDPDSFFPLIRAIERWSGKGYEHCLIASVRKQPTPVTVWLVCRVINADPPEKAVFLSLLSQIAARVELPERIRLQAAQFFEHHTQGPRQTTHSPLFPEVTPERREALQEAFGRHIARERDREAARVRQLIEGDRKFWLPLYDRMLGRLRQLDPATRADVASAALLMADEIVTGILTVFDGSDSHAFEGGLVNYAIVAQLRDSQSLEVREQVDVNRGDPVIAVWDQYKKWLSRYTPSELRASSVPRSLPGEC
jgi:hypothetical protein